MNDAIHPFDRVGSEIKLTSLLVPPVPDRVLPALPPPTIRCCGSDDRILLLPTRCCRDTRSQDPPIGRSPVRVQQKRPFSVAIAVAIAVATVIVAIGRSPATPGHERAREAGLDAVVPQFPKGCGSVRTPDPQNSAGGLVDPLVPFQSIEDASGSALGQHDPTDGGSGVIVIAIVINVIVVLFDFETVVFSVVDVSELVVTVVAVEWWRNGRRKILSSRGGHCVQNGSHGVPLEGNHRDDPPIVQARLVFVFVSVFTTARVVLAELVPHQGLYLVRHQPIVGELVVVVVLLVMVCLLLQALAGPLFGRRRPESGRHDDNRVAKHGGPSLERSRQVEQPVFFMAGIKIRIRIGIRIGTGSSR
mmetsp:Transcript_21560/g.59874  ORF Transcript_21560/g.59874 Transcript_21560/m.59874 type:complete len:361 (-) Transcript_21560:1428-2510(-)